MSLEQFIENPWKKENLHPLYVESFLNMRPAPEYASGEVILASTYRNVGFKGCVSERGVPKNGRDLLRRLDKARTPDGIQLEPEVLKSLLTGPLSSPKQPNQSSKRFLQTCPIVPDATLYSLSARLSTGSWNPGELIARIIGFGISDEKRLNDIWLNLYKKLSVNGADDVWARFLQQELIKWRGKEAKDGWRPPEKIDPIPAISKFHTGPAQIPAEQFVEDLNQVIGLKTHLTRRQWISSLESLLRLGSTAHIMWLCRAGNMARQGIVKVISGEQPHDLEAFTTETSVGRPFWRYGQAAGRTIKEYAQEFVLSRLTINLLLWHCESQGGASKKVLKNDSFSNLPSIVDFIRRLKTNSDSLDLNQFRTLLHKVIEGNQNTISCKKGIGSNISEFLRHAIGQRQTFETGLDSYDQGYYLRKKGHYNSAPWIVSLGPVSVLTLVHCCTSTAKGPSTVEDFCRHIARYGIDVRAQDVAQSDLGQSLRNLGVVLDSPDAEGGMVLVSPFKTQNQGLDS